MTMNDLSSTAEGFPPTNHSNILSKPIYASEYIYNPNLTPEAKGDISEEGWKDDSSQRRGSVFYI